ncbi:MAG: type II toxin-antitoxin system PemK/MazF family toxin [Anaerolineales bacterium]|nr:MAG: type II toxin-antitoxin system PemK/MazF family toxin [Anaerolineales bacterium]
MARILRGDIYWADLNPVRGHEQAGVRPVIIISHDVFNENSGTVIAMTITRQPQRAGFPLTHELISGKIRNQSWVKISQVRTISTSRLDKKIGQVDLEELNIIIDGLNEIVSS